MVMVELPHPATTDLGPVQVLRWPLEADRRDPQRFAACLWLLPAGELRPEPVAHEDWLRLPADDLEVADRVRRLAGETAPGPLVVGDVTVSEDGLVRFERARRLEVADVYLPRVEAEILRLLAASPERVVPRATLVAQVWGDVGHRGRPLDSRVFSLRRRVAPLGLTIHTVRGRGYLLGSAPRATVGVRATGATSA